MAVTYNARAMARRVNDALRDAGVAKSIDAKRVRAWVRDNVEAFDDDGYTAHVYDEATADTIEAGMLARYVKGRGTSESDERGTAASEGRPDDEPGDDDGEGADADA